MLFDQKDYKTIKEIKCHSHEGVIYQVLKWLYATETNLFSTFSF